MADDLQAVEAWPCRSCGMSLRDCTEEPDPLGVCCAVCGQAARGNHGEYEWRPTARHRVIGEFSGDPSCAACHHAWPCPTAREIGSYPQDAKGGYPVVPDA